MPIQIVLLGDRKSGKTTLSRRLTHPEMFVNLSPPSDDDAEDRPFAEYSFSNSWSIWTINRHLGRLGSTYYTPADIALYCVDLSVPYNAQNITEELSEFREQNPDAPIVLVGTKKDIYEDDAEARIASISAEVQSKLHEHGFEGLAKPISFTAQNNDDRDQLAGLLLSFPIQQEKPQNHLLLKARDKLPSESILYQAINHFISTIVELDLSEAQLMQLGQQTNALIYDLRNPLFSAKGMAIETFAKNCNLILDGQPSIVANAIEGIVAAVLVTIFAFAVGFAIGCALGAWTGPFALLTGIATGSAAAVTLLTVSGGCGALIGGLTAFGVFKAPSIGSQAINELKAAAMEEICSI
jgi:hypothetical protein